MVSKATAWGLAVAALVVTGLAGMEFAKLCNPLRNDSAPREKLIRISYALVITMPAALVFLGSLGDSMQRQVVFLLGGLTLSFILCLAVIMWRGATSLGEASSAARDLPLGLLHLGLGGGALVALVRLPDPHWPLLWLLLVVCLNDTAALFVGSRLQGPKLNEVISPNKTWAGSAGGVAAGILVGLLCERFIAPGELVMTFTRTVFIAAIVVIAGQLGDLAKSFIKRVYGVKDTGTLLPGHGGIIDRIDAVYAAAPVLYCWLLLNQ